MEFLKKFFKDDEKVIGLCAFKKNNRQKPLYNYAFSVEKPVFYTNTKNNFFLL